jgi:hypothetical protein
MASKIKIVSILFVFCTLFIFSKSYIHAATYTGRYTNGLVVSENNSVVDGADISGGGVCLRITGDNVTVKKTKVHDCQDHGVLFLGTNGGLIENSEIYRAAMRNPPNSISGGWPSLLKVQSVDESTSGLAHDITIRNNYIHEGYGECMGLRGSRINVTGNHVKDCYSIGIYSNSDHTRVENNIVECSGNTHYNRDGYPMAGIGFAEETFVNWGAHGHDTQTVLRNTVTGCKYGFRYGRSENNMGLANTEIAYNKFLNIKVAPISITHYPNETNINIHDNVTNGSVPTSIPSSTPRPSSTSAGKPGDVNSDNKVDIIDIGIVIDNYGRIPIPNLKADVNRDGSVNIIDIGMVTDNYGK